jgi:hypothetical protein
MCVYIYMYAYTYTYVYTYICVCVYIYVYVYIYSFRPRSMNCLIEGKKLCQKRPITVSKETYYSVKRDLLQCQKRPITQVNELLNRREETLRCEQHQLHHLNTEFRLQDLGFMV